MGADTALAELKGRMESAKSEAAQLQPDIEAQTRQSAIERNMTKAVSALTNLPADVQAQAEAGAARKALYDYMKADEGGKAAAYDKAAKVLRGSISSVLTAGKLDAGTRQTLEGALDNIDSRGEMGDNSNNKRAIGKPKKYDYKEIFFKVNPELRGLVIVHHSIEQQVLSRPDTTGLFTEEEINAYEKLRGIPNELNNEVHLSKIRKIWNKFYKDITKGKVQLTKENFLKKAREIDEIFGDLFNPKIK